MLQGPEMTTENFTVSCLSMQLVETKNKDSGAILNSRLVALSLHPTTHPKRGKNLIITKRLSSLLRPDQITINIFFICLYSMLISADRCPFYYYINNTENKSNN